MLIKSPANAYPLAECQPGGCESALYKRQTIVVEGPGDVGTGAIVGRKDNTYTFLTSAHVIPARSKVSEYTIFSPLNGKRYPLRSISTPLGKKADIAVGSFRVLDGETFNLAVINSMTCLAKQDGLEKAWCTRGPGGRMGGYSKPSASISVPIFRYNEFALQDRIPGNKDGYEFVYEAATFPGMSGAPIFGDTGPQIYSSCAGLYYGLVAIHGKSEGYESNGQLLGRSGMSLGVPVDLIKDYLFANAEKFGIPKNTDEIKTIIHEQYCTPVDSKITGPNGQLKINGKLIYP